MKKKMRKHNDVIEDKNIKKETETHQNQHCESTTKQNRTDTNGQGSTDMKWGFFETENE